MTLFRKTIPGVCIVDGETWETQDPTDELYLEIRVPAWFARALAWGFKVFGVNP